MGFRPADLHASIGAFLGGARRVAVLGVGSDLRADDAAGLLAIAEIRRRLQKKRHPARPNPETPSPGSTLCEIGSGSRSVLLIHASTVPESFTGEIRRFSPTHLILVDAAEFHLAPGSIGLIDADDAGGMSFCSHALPLGLVARYLSQETGCAVLVLGIQPFRVAFGVPMSADVEHSARVLAAHISRCLVAPANLLQAPNPGSVG
jgi:hydrogenase 3 maturation protease